MPQLKVATFDVKRMIKALGGPKGLRILLQERGFVCPSEAQTHQWHRRAQIPPKWLACLLAAEPRVLLKFLVIRRK